MTVIAGAIDKDGTVFMGADHVGSDEGRVWNLSQPKIKRCGAYLIGCAGPVRVAQIAHYLFKPPAPPKRGDLFAFMVTRFAARLRDCMKEHGGEVKEDKGDTEVMDADLLVAVAGHLFQIDSNYSVIEVREPYNAVGCASQEAKVAMHARRGSRAKSMVEAGLDGAAAYDINIRPPFTIESLPHKGGK